MPLCELCSNLDLSSISQSTVNDLFRLGETVYPDHSLFSYTSRDNNLRREANNLTPHHASLTSLSACAKSCDLCRLIQSSIGGFWEGFESRKRLGFQTSPPDYELWLGGRDDADGFQILGLERGITTHRLFYQLLGGIDFCLDNVAASHLENAIQGRKVSLSPKSSLVLERIKGWIKACTEGLQHVGPQPNWMPTRLIKIGDLGREVCLQTADMGNDKYATLSHCWGATPPTILTSCNLPRLKVGIRTEELPRTFQDAIWLTHQLQIPFIWIDSLCIIQDDPDDWTQESARMHHVYRNSFLNIAASRAAKSSEGFLGNRIERSYLPVPFNYQGTVGEILAFPLPLNCVGDPKRSVWIEHEPLTSRGWALQERYLPRRTLHFTSHQILFEHEQHCLAEGIALDHKLPSMTNAMSDDYFKNVDGKTCLQNWYRLVEMYSMRKLTIADDKLPALGGLATHFSCHRRVEFDITAPPSRYLAGLWSEDMIRGLCWQSSGGLHPPNYRAPTWSWASLDGRIDYGIPWIDEMNELAEVEGVHVDLKSPESSFGKVLGGWISMKVIKLRPCGKSDTENGNLWLNEDGAKFQLGVSWDLESYRAGEQGDSPAFVIKETELLVVPLGWIADRAQGLDDPDRLLGPFCLVLETLDHPNHSHTTTPTFQRVGSCMVMPDPNSKEGLSEWKKLKRLIIDKWAIMKQQGKLEDIIIV